MTRDDPDKCTTPYTSAVRGPSKVPSDKQDGPSGPNSPGLFALAGMGLSIAVCVAGGLGFGIYLDGTSHHSPLFTLLGLAVGVAIAVALAYLQIKRFL